jgi:hypothetical protein
MPRTARVTGIRMVWYGHLRCKGGHRFLLARRYRPDGWLFHSWGRGRLAAVICGLLAFGTAVFDKLIAIADKGRTGGSLCGAAPGRHRPRDRRRQYGGLAGRPDRDRAAPGRGRRSCVRGPQAGRPPRCHRHHGLIQLPATVDPRLLDGPAPRVRPVRQTAFAPEPGPTGGFKQRRGQPAALAWRAPASANHACRERQAVRNGPLADAFAGTGSSAGSRPISGKEVGRVSVPRIRAP